MKRFRCITCTQISLVRGGTVGFRCEPCRVAAGETVAQRLQRAAHKAVADAIRAGTLARPDTKPCADCNGSAIEYDHRDYGAPLAVDPVCRRCNLARGPAIGSPALEARAGP